MRVLWAIAVLGLLAVPPGPAEAGTRPAKTAPAAKPPAKPSSPAKAAPRGSTSQLEKARANLAALKQNPTKRKFRHNWERAIRDLERAARGPDAGPALLDAARARYALYRWSAVEADREKALALAARATKAGSSAAPALAAAIRREAGDEEPPRARPEPPATARKGTPPAKGAPARPPPVPVAPPPDEEAPDPVLEEAVADGEPPSAPAPAGAPPAAGGPAKVSEVQTWTGPDYTRVAVYLSQPVGYEKQEIPADPEHPRRLALDLRPAVLDGQGQQKSVGDALVQSVRMAQYAPDTVRVVLDLKGQDAYQLFTLAEPPRLIVDVGTRQAQNEAVARSIPPAAIDEEDGDADAETALRPVRHVIVDAGHGGHDTGAIGPRGVREKDVTLAMANRLATRLRAEGFKVTLTRTDDRYLKLEERTAIANMARGDLFVSIHANAHPRRDRRGTETYYLNVNSDRYARRLAARENGILEEEESDAGVQRILTDLNAKASAGASRRLAGMVQKEVTSRVRARQGDVRDLGVKNALFYVLLGARMPAVLVETAFISNRVEEQRLASPAFQQVVADGVAQAVLDFAGRPHLAAR